MNHIPDFPDDYESFTEEEFDKAYELAQTLSFTEFVYCGDLYAMDGGSRGYRKYYDGNEWELGLRGTSYTKATQAEILWWAAKVKLEHDNVEIELLKAKITDLEQENQNLRNLAADNKWQTLP